MAIPKYQDLYPLILKFSTKEQTADEYLARVADALNLSEDELTQRYPSGEGVVRNRVRWSIHYLRRANLLTKPARGSYVITERGREFLTKYPGQFTNKDLAQFPEFQAFRKQSASTEEEVSIDSLPNLFPIAFDLSPYLFLVKPEKTKPSSDPLTISLRRFLIFG